jgi:tRNA threonylcarbamoyladenosine biosynthesis protein TsaE
MKQLDYLSNDLVDTDRLGLALAECLPEGTVVGLCGTLGSGKTRLVQAIAAACGVPRDSVVSPTFVLCQEYYGRRSLIHMDAYRLQNEREFQQLGPEEYFASPAITLIEWADRVASCLPDERLQIDIEILPDDSRRFVMKALASVLEPSLDRIDEHLRQPVRE